MKTLKFSEKLVQGILSGEKYKTWRLFDDKNLSIGEIVQLVNRQDGHVFATAEIFKISEKSLKDVVHEDEIGNGGFYKSNEDMYRVLQGYYSGSVTPETVVKIVEFKLI